MNDKELFERFERYFKENGYTFDKAAKLIGVTKNSLFNWKNGRPISPKARNAMLVLMCEPPETKISDNFLREILDCWEYLDPAERAKVAGVASELAAPKKKHENTAGSSAAAV